MTRDYPSGRWPNFERDELDAAQRVLTSGKVNYWTGTECQAFEREFADYHGVAHAVALANGTLALELALRIFDVGPGDEVIVTPRSFFASASCIIQVGARPVFADVDADSQNVTPQAIEQKLTENTKAIIAVHLAGWPCDMTGIMKLAGRYGLRVIEDCAQAHGARLHDRLVGSFGDAAAFSFCQDKIMSTAGEGGMLLTNDSAAWERAWAFRDHGKSRARVNSADHSIGFRWLHESFGSNWRMTEIQGAIGRLQLRKLDDWVRVRRANARRLADGFADLAVLRVPEPSAHELHAYYKFYSFVEPRRLRQGWSRDRILAELDKRGIPGLSGSCPEIYREQAFDGFGYETLPVARSLGETSIMHLVHPTLTASDLSRVIDSMREICAAASK